MTQVTKFGKLKEGTKLIKGSFADNSFGREIVTVTERIDDFNWKLSNGHTVKDVSEFEPTIWEDGETFNDNYYERYDWNAENRPEIMELIEKGLYTMAAREGHKI